MFTFGPAPLLSSKQLSKMEHLAEALDPGLPRL